MSLKFYESCSYFIQCIYMYREIPKTIVIEVSLSEFMLKKNFIGLCPLYTSICLEKYKFKKINNIFI